MLLMLSPFNDRTEARLLRDASKLFAYTFMSVSKEMLGETKL